MAYEWEGMKKLTREEVGAKFANSGMVGLYKLYDDDTEALIESPMTLQEVMDNLDRGIEFGEEK